MDRIVDEANRAEEKNTEILKRAWEKWERAQDERASQIFACAAACFVWLFALGMAGCANAEKSYLVGHNTALQAVSGAYRALDAYDEKKIASILATAEQDVAAARLEFVEYHKQIVKAKKSLGVAADGLEVRHHGSKLYEWVALKRWDKALQEVLSIGLSVRDALGLFGIEVF